tara:strand:- start:401 stop:616 length:216 start_codon:yes stop_codon:yes gene_type:complete
MRLSDNSISQLVRVLQLALLTGTDITDNLRTMRFVDEDGILDPDPEYSENFENNLEKLREEANKLNESSDE